MKLVAQYNVAFVSVYSWNGVRNQIPVFVVVWKGQHE